MAAPFADIATPRNPVRSDRREFADCVATVATIRYGHVVIDAATANHRDVALPAGAGALGVRGVVADQGNPNTAYLFATGDEFGACISGTVEAWLDAGATATADAPCITGGTPGTVKQVAAEAAPYDIVGTFAQTYDNSGGAAAVLISIHVRPYRRFA